MDEAHALFARLLRSRRRVAAAMLEAFAAKAFEPAAPEDVAELEAEVAYCDAELARLGRG